MTINEYIVNKFNTTIESHIVRNAKKCAIMCDVYDATNEQLDAIIQCTKSFLRRNVKTRLIDELDDTRTIQQMIDASYELLCAYSCERDASYEHLTLPIIDMCIVAIMCRANDEMYFLC